MISENWSVNMEKSDRISIRSPSILTAMAISLELAGYVFPRSSMAAKGLVCELPPIDSGYRGKIHAIISNVSTSSQIIHKDTRVGQLVITPVVIADFVLDLGEERGTGAFGSTGE